MCWYQTTGTMLHYLYEGILYRQPKPPLLWLHLPYRTLLLTLCFKDLYSINIPPSQLADGPVLQTSSVFRLAVSSGIYPIRLNGFSLLSTNMVSNWFEPLPCYASFLIH